MGIRGGLTITAVAPAAWASRLYLMHVRVPSAVVPATTPIRPLTWFDHDLQHALPLAVVQPRDFAGHAQHRDAVDAGGDEQIDDAAEAVLVDVPGRRERRRQDRIHTLELHPDSSLRH